MEGWIKIHRKILDWEWWDDNTTFRFFIYLIFSANIENKKWHGLEIERGSFVTSRKRLSEDLHLSERQVRTCLGRLKTTNEIAIKTTNKYSIITICNYGSYQVDYVCERQTERPAKSQQTTTTKEYKNIYKETSTKVDAKKSLSLTLTENLEKRNKSFYESLVPYVETYGKELIRAFYDYWTEPNKSKTKMRFELQRTWDVQRRLNTWSSREIFKSNGNGKYKTNSELCKERNDDIAEEIISHYK